MAVFFFLIGPEIKRDIMEWELSSFPQFVLRGMGALGGMVVPATIYAWFNSSRRRRRPHDRGCKGVREAIVHQADCKCELTSYNGQISLPWVGD
jgi:hypothetical protein